ncbi:unnamed protein product [Sphagnum troendelagicum]|uniref:Uncharacterized protein n=1 Tax=Sphagnum troendelagicum TaxID=128251 RepID=A0ABP0UMP3_9BRYO
MCFSATQCPLKQSAHQAGDTENFPLLSWLEGRSSANYLLQFTTLKQMRPLSISTPQRHENYKDYTNEKGGGYSNNKMSAVHMEIWAVLPPPSSLS